jgi:hypothetical protein
MALRFPGQTAVAVAATQRACQLDEIALHILKFPWRASITMSVTKREAAQGVDRVTCFQGENATMNSPILPVGGPSGPSIAGSAATVAGDVDDLLAGLNAGGGALSLAVARIGPPLEVLEQIAAASATERRLRAGGQQLRFFAGTPGARMRVEIHDRDGRAVRTLTVSEAFNLVAGRPARLEAL